MSFVEEIKASIPDINEINFAEYTLAVFDFQFSKSEVYNQYCSFLKKSPSTVKSVDEIPFLPISFFKHHVVKSGTWESRKVFKSSGTGQSRRSHHHVRDVEFYEYVSKLIYEHFNGPVSTKTLLALLPSYQSQGASSLVHMVNHLMKYSCFGSGYVGKEMEKFNEILENDDPTIVIGVSFALLDWMDKGKIRVKNSQIMETGGMKGRRKEITRQELHDQLKEGFGVPSIMSEYGMTELFSQFYSIDDGRFNGPPWTKILVRDINDPFSPATAQSTGGINVIDLANIDTCSFIETEDLGKIYLNEQFEVIGRLDNTDIRGCNLMV